MSKDKITIGGSDVSAILGLNPYFSAKELWEIKTGRKPPKEFTNKMKVGVYFEKAIAEMFEDSNGFKIVKNSYENDKFCHPEKDYLVAVLDYTSEEKSVIIEIKYSNVDYDVMEPSYMAQLEYYLWLANQKWPDKYKIGYLACVSKGEYKEVKVEWDKDKDERYKSVILPKIEYFYKACLEDFEPVDLMPEIIEIKTESRTISEDDYKLYKNYKAVISQIKKLEAEKDAIAKILKDKYGDAEETIYEDEFSGKVVVARVISYEKENFDSKKFCKDYPDLYEKFVSKQKISYFKIL